MLRGWFARHRNRTNFLLHMAGIPATILAVPLVLTGRWALGVGLFVVGYALQFLGHLIEGNRSGEEQLLRRLFKREQRP